MDVHVGTSGFAYPAWKGSFYPEQARDPDLLAYYAGRFDTVEVNSTFYRFPTARSLAAWANQVPECFRFALKVPQRITHRKQLRAIEDDLAYLLATAISLGPRLGPLLFELPPRMPIDLARLTDCIVQLPPGLRAAFEFRHPSWFCEEVYEVLAQQGCALCFDDARASAPRATTAWGYVRLRRERYDEAGLAHAAVQVLSQPWREAYVFLKHEAADAPLLARRLAELAAEPTRLKLPNGQRR